MKEYVRIAGMWHVLTHDADATRCSKLIQWFQKWAPKTLSNLPVYHVDAVCHAHEIPDIACIDCAMSEIKEGKTC